MLLQTINAGEGVEEKGTLLHCWWECKSVQLLWEQYGRTTRGSSNPTPEHISRENHNLKRHMHPSVHSGTIHSSQDMEATYMSIDRGMDKEDAVHKYSGILLSHKKGQKNAISPPILLAFSSPPRLVSEITSPKKLPHTALASGFSF